jgi:hypothetical protein
MDDDLEGTMMDYLGVQGITDQPCLGHNVTIAYAALSSSNKF